MAQTVNTIGVPAALNIGANSTTSVNHHNQQNDMCHCDKQHYSWHFPAKSGINQCFLSL